MRTLAVLSIALVSAGCVSAETYRRKETEAVQLASQVKAEEGRRAELQRRFDDVQKELDQMGADLTDLRERLEAREASSAAAHVQLQQRSAGYERMAAALKGQIGAGKVELTELRGRMTVKLKDRILFSSGSAALGKQGKAALAAVAGVLGGAEGRLVRVEGHTDDVPAGGPYPSNWELSAARAVAVVRFLQARGVDPSRLAAAGFGPYRPVAPNVTATGRSRNRRIEIVLAPAEDGASSDPDPAARPGT